MSWNHFKVSKDTYGSIFETDHRKVIEKTLSENRRRRLRMVLGMVPLSGVFTIV